MAQEQKRKLKAPSTVSEAEVEQWFDEEESEQEDTTDVGEAVGDASIEAKYAASQIQVVRSTIDFTLHTLRQSLSDPNYINISPSYQRRTRWDRKRRSQLIESFLMNIPIPPIFLFENQYNQYETMDGRQRLETIHGFLDNHFSLTGMEYFKELNGKRFSDLTPTIQRGLLRRSITAIVLLAETTRPDAKHDVRMILFRRLNTGGARLNPQEMRNALYPGHFNNMLAEIARTDLFTKVWRIPTKTDDEDEKVPRNLARNAMYRTMADCELVLRFFAIRETIEQKLSGSIRALLDKCMERHAADSEKRSTQLGQRFTQCLEKLNDIFDDEPFVLPNTKRLSRPLYDALMVALSIDLPHKHCAPKKTAQSRLMASLNDPHDYDVLIGRGNTVDAIRNRVKLASKILF